MLLQDMSGNVIKFVDILYIPDFNQLVQATGPGIQGGRVDERVLLAITEQ